MKNIIVVFILSIVANLSFGQGITIGPLDLGEKICFTWRPGESFNDDGFIF
jgi:hypothetical protein